MSHRNNATGSDDKNEDFERRQNRNNKVYRSLGKGANPTCDAPRQRMKYVMATSPAWPVEPSILYAVKNGTSLKVWKPWLMGQTRELNRTAARTMDGAQLSVPSACTCV